MAPQGGVGRGEIAVFPRTGGQSAAAAAARHSCSALCCRPHGTRSASDPARQTAFAVRKLFESWLRNCVSVCCCPPAALATSEVQRLLRTQQAAPTVAHNERLLLIGVCVAVSALETRARERARQRQDAHGFRPVPAGVTPRSGALWPSCTFFDSALLSVGARAVRATRRAQRRCTCRFRPRTASTGT